MTDWHIAQINVARARFPLDDPRLADFMGKLDEVNALAENSPGFVWRLQSDAGNAMDIQVTEDPRFVVNMSVWRDVESLFDFAYKSAHRLVMVRRREWFEKPSGAYQALWWIPAGQPPSAEEGLKRLERLNRGGPSPQAFSFKSKFPPPDCTGAPEDMKPDPYCVGWR